MLTNAKQVRAQFWTEHLEWTGQPRKPARLPNGDYPTDTRVAFCDWVDSAARAGIISERLAGSVTL